MEISDTQLLRELRRALDAAADGGTEAQAKALEEALGRLGATMADVARALNAVKERRRRELSGLARRIGALAERQADAEETADAVDRFLRDLGAHLS